MIICPVCSTQNDEFSIECKTCKSFLQDRVPTLDLFYTMWQLIDLPAKTMKRIVLAEHKNYVLVFSLFLGMTALFALMWIKQSGLSFDNLFPLLLFGVGVGFVISIPLFFLLTTSIHAISRFIGGKGKFKDTYGVVGWSLTPLAISFFFVLPVVFASLGLYLFSANPSAYQIKPLVTVVLLGIYGLFILWSIFLLTIGISITHRFKYSKGFFVAVGVTSALSYGVYLAYSLFNI